MKNLNENNRKYIEIYDSDKNEVKNCMNVKNKPMFEENEDEWIIDILPQTPLSCSEWKRG